MTSNVVGTTTGVNAPGRIVDVLAVPYGELSMLTGHPAGERVQFGAFAAACQHPEKVLLFRGHDHAHPLGRAIALWEEPDGLHGTFMVRPTLAGDELLADVLDGYVLAASIGFRATTVGRGREGELIVLEADLREVSLLSIGAYDGAKVLAVRRPTDRPGTWPSQPPTRAARRPLTGRGYLGEISGYTQGWPPARGQQ